MTSAMQAAKDPPLPKPNELLESVFSVRIAANMPEDEFKDFKRMVRKHANEYLDVSGRVSVDDQEPFALVGFLDAAKRHDPTLERRYADAWPILAYLEVYIGYRKLSQHRRKSTGSSSPIWLRRTHPVRAGEHSRTRTLRPKRKSVAEYWRESSRAIATEEVGHENYQPDDLNDSGLAGSASGSSLWPVLGSFLMNMGKSFGEICSG